MQCRKRCSGRCPRLWQTAEECWLSTWLEILIIILVRAQAIPAMFGAATADLAQRVAPGKNWCKQSKAWKKCLMLLFIRLIVLILSQIFHWKYHMEIPKGGLVHLYGHSNYHLGQINYLPRIQPGQGGRFIIFFLLMDEKIPVESYLWTLEILNYKLTHC